MIDCQCAASGNREEALAFGPLQEPEVEETEAEVDGSRDRHGEKGELHEQSENECDHRENNRWNDGFLDR